MSVCYVCTKQSSRLRDGDKRTKYGTHLLGTDNTVSDVTCTQITIKLIVVRDLKEEKPKYNGSTEMKEINSGYGTQGRLQEGGGI